MDTMDLVLIVPKTDYSNTLYIGLFLKSVQKLQQVHNAASRLITGMANMNTYPQSWHAFTGPVSFNSQFKVLVMSLYSLHGYRPQYLLECLSHKIATCLTHSSQYMNAKNSDTKGGPKS